MLVFGGVIGRDIVDIFMTLDTRTWEETEAVLPQERWKEVEARLKAKGLEEHEINQHKTDWQVRAAATRCRLRISPASHPHLTPHLTHISRLPYQDEMKKKEKDLVKQQKKEERKARLRRERGEDTGAITASSKAPSEMTDGEEEPDDGRGDGRREGYDEDEIRLPTRMMPAMQFGQWVPVRIGHYAPPASFGHAMCLCGTDVFVYGGRTRDDARHLPLLPGRAGAVALGAVRRRRPRRARVPRDAHARALHVCARRRRRQPLVQRPAAARPVHDALGAAGDEGRGPRREARRADRSLGLVGRAIRRRLRRRRRRKPSNDLHTLDLRTLLWEAAQTEGAPPAPRVGHSSTQLGSEMWVFGGFSKGKYFHDVHVLDVEQLEWRQVIVAGTPPHGRVSHSATLYNGQIHIFGGSAGGHCYNDYLVLKPGKPTDADISNSSPPKGAPPARSRRTRR